MCVAAGLVPAHLAAGFGAPGGEPAEGSGLLRYYDLVVLAARTPRELQR